MKKILIITALLIFGCNYLEAQIVDDVEQEYNQMKDSIDAEYLALTKAIWEEFEAVKTEAGYKKPKPKIPPKVEPDKVPDKPKPISPNPIVVKPKPRIKLPVDDFTERRSSNFEEKLKEIASISSYNTNVDFYGASFKLYYDDIDFAIVTVSHKSITASFKHFMDNVDAVENIVIQLVEYAAIMELNDYAFMKLVRETALTMFKDVNKSNIFTWFVMNACEYDCKLAYNDAGDVFIVVPSSIPIYRTASITIKGKRYYVVTFNLQEYKKITIKLITYLDNPLNSNKTLDFIIGKAPDINNKFAQTKRDMPNISKTFSINYDKSYVSLLKNMPILDYPVYFHIPMSSKTYEDIKTKFAPYLDGKTEFEKVRFLLSFVQQGFPYKYDIDNFGRGEQPLAPEESLFYSHSDCEDHAALFAYLVTALTDCEVLGVLYSDHATTAVKFKHTRPKGYYLPKPYDDYILCESTTGGNWVPMGIVSQRYVGVQPERVFKIDRKFIMHGLK